MRDIPMLKMLKRYKSKLRFHTPGHKGKLYGLKDAAYDITELSFSDNALCPQGVIAGLNDRLQSVYHRPCRVLAGGASGGVFVMLSAFENKRVLLSRHSHVSVFNALRLFRITPILLDNYISSDSPLLSVKDVEARIEECDAVLATYPDYYGRTCDLKKIHAIAKAHGKAMLVDSAHGGHFAYSEALPESASLSSDICVFGVHKTCLALTGSAVICFREEYRKEMLSGMRRVLSTSPSYLLLSSVDISHHFMLQYYDGHIRKLAAVIDEQAGKAGDFAVLKAGDPAKLVIDCSAAGRNGFEVGQALEKKGVYCELSDERRVVFILTLHDSVSKLKKLFRILRSFKRGEKIFCREPALLPCGEARLNAQFDSESVLLRDSVGRICAESVGLYPPGVPLLLRGEVITEEIAAILIAGKECTFGLTGEWIEVEK